MKLRVTVIDCGLGNLFSVSQALRKVGADVVVSSDAEELLKSDALILPGVGAFGDAMNKISNEKP